MVTNHRRPVSLTLFHPRHFQQCILVDYNSQPLVVDSGRIEWLRELGHFPLEWAQNKQRAMLQVQLCRCAEQYHWVNWMSFATRVLPSLHLSLLEEEDILKRGYTRSHDNFCKPLFVA